MSSQSEPLPDDFEKRLLKGLIRRLLSNLDNEEYDMPAAEMQLIRQLCSDNSVSFASIKRGDFGETARRVAEDFPFDEGGNVVSMGGRP